jgi:hypothetical protein
MWVLLGGFEAGVGANYILTVYLQMSIQTLKFTNRYRSFGDHF